MRFIEPMTRRGVTNLDDSLLCTHVTLLRKLDDKVMRRILPLATSPALQGVFEPQYRDKDPPSPPKVSSSFHCLYLIAEFHGESSVRVCPKGYYFK